MTNKITFESHDGKHIYKDITQKLYDKTLKNFVEEHVPKYDEDLEEIDGNEEGYIE